MTLKTKPAARGAQLLQEFGSPAFGLFFFLMALVLQISHTQLVIWLAGQPASVMRDMTIEALKTLNAGYDWWFALFGAIAFEGATLWFISSGNRGGSYVFAFFGMGMNVGYYDFKGYDMIGAPMDNAIRWAVSVGVPTLIVFYAHQVKLMASYQEETSASATPWPKLKWPQMNWFANFTAGIAARAGNTHQTPPAPRNDYELTDSPVVVPKALPDPSTPPTIDASPETQALTLDDRDKIILRAMLAGVTQVSVLAQHVGMSIPGLYRANPEKGKLHNLKKLGLVMQGDNGWTLTEKGRKQEWT